MPKTPIFTLQRRENKQGDVAFRAIFNLKGRVYDGWGKTPEEAHHNLKEKLYAMRIMLHKNYNI